MILRKLLIDSYLQQISLSGSGRGSSEPDGRGSGSSGGASGGRGPGKRDPPTPADVSEQIATALERLQRDMNSVLIRLNTLEALALSRQQVGLGSVFDKAKKKALSQKPAHISM